MQLYFSVKYQWKERGHLWKWYKLEVSHQYFKIIIKMWNVISLNHQYQPVSSLNQIHPMNSCLEDFYTRVHGQYYTIGYQEWKVWFYYHPFFLYEFLPYSLIYYVLIIPIHQVIFFMRQITLHVKSCNFFKSVIKSILHFGKISITLFSSFYNWINFMHFLDNSCVTQKCIRMSPRIYCITFSSVYFFFKGIETTIFLFFLLLMLVSCLVHFFSSLETYLVTLKYQTWVTE